MMERSTYEQKTPIPFEEGQYQPCITFRTREGGLGVLRILGADKTTNKIEFRYKMLHEDATGEMEIDSELQQLTESANRLKQMGLVVTMFADDHEARLPVALQELKDYVEYKEELRWIVDNVEYIGKGKTVKGSSPFVTAYDKTILVKNKGTNVLFSDGHIAFWTPKQLKEHGITGGR